jgi:hypothetical protein
MDNTRSSSVYFAREEDGKQKLKGDADGIRDHSL